MLTTGLSYLFQSATSTIASSISNLEDNSNMFFIARVIDISLNSNSEIFNNSGGWAGIGSIKFQQLDISVTPSSKNEESTTFAKPITGQLKNYPLVNELVLIFRGPSTKQTQITNTKNFYYINTVAIWGNQHINAYPDSYFTNTDLAPSMGKSNDEILAGSTNKNTTQTTTIPLNGNSGGTFEEKGNIHPILPFAGDNIFEGRFGNSIRLGNTSKAGGIITNNWSTGNNTENGDPITIIKNGQPLSGSSEGYLPITEDINNDPTSIYLTSTQKIPFDIAVALKREGEGSTIPYSNIISPVPKSPKSYNGPQVILNSGRLLFNTHTDSILLSSQKSIVLTSIEDLGIQSQTKNVNIISDKGVVSLGKQNASESVILGDTFINDFTALIDNLKTLCSALGKEGSLPIASSLANILSQSGGVLDNISNRAQAGDYKSKKVKTT
jgi:hypothetical protein